MQRTFAVEAKPSQVLKLPGFTCNGYIVAGHPFLHIFGTGETFEVTTTPEKKNAFLQLVEARLNGQPIPIAGFEPRPSRKSGWSFDQQAGVWTHAG